MESAMLEEAETTTVDLPPPNPDAWRDFPIEDHINAFIGLEMGETAVVKAVMGDHYRVNIFKNISDETSVMRSKTTLGKSYLLKVVETPEGYVITDITV